jgi:hypothetical protein
MARRSSQSIYSKELIQRRSAEVSAIPAPIGGWNARDSLANMDPMDAVEMVNMFPTPSAVSLRGGYTRHATGIDGNVQTLLTYNAGANSKMFAATSTGKIYDVTNPGVVGAPVVTGLSSGVFEYVNITTAGGSFLMAVNGVDTPILYNGTTFTAPSITGVTLTNLANVTLFKNRIWFIEKNTLKAWYLPVSSIGGAVSLFDFSSVCRWGGYLVDFDSWTNDAGYGADDNFVLVTSKGEIIAYRGTNPDSAGTWALIGIWKMGAPVAQRCMFKWAGDLLVLTYDGLTLMSQALSSDRTNEAMALSDKIQSAIGVASESYGGSNNGWQIFYSPKHDALWVNIPISAAGQEQYVMNTITRSWCRFQGWRAFCWELYNDDPYFGAGGYVAKAWDTNTYSDDGANITTKTLQAFNHFEARGIFKTFTRAKPTFFSSGSPTFQVGINVDYNISDTTAPLTASAVSKSLWGTAIWNDATWYGSQQVISPWVGIVGMGSTGAIQVKTASNGIPVQWASTEVLYQQGWPGA